MKLMSIPFELYFKDITPLKDTDIINGLLWLMWTDQILISDIIMTWNLSYEMAYIHIIIFHLTL